MCRHFTIKASLIVSSAVCVWYGLSGMRVMFASPWYAGWSDRDGVHVRFDAQSRCTFDEIGWVEWYRPEFGDPPKQVFPSVYDSEPRGFVPYWLIVVPLFGATRVRDWLLHRLASRNRCGRGFDVERVRGGEFS